MFPYFFIFMILFLSTNSILPDELRKELLEKLTREIYKGNDKIKEKEEQGLKITSLRNNIDYNISKIDELLEKYNFSKNFNFYEYTNIKKVVKDQGRCGGCWAFASTSALAYRFEKKYNISLDLSPQDGLSCYTKDCNSGNYGIDPQLNLLINGTVTESCFPFVSGDDPDYIPECRTSSCEDDSEFKRYYSSSIYTTEDIVYDNREEDFYDFVLIIIDQLITKGPVVTLIDVYDDFQRWFYDSFKCKTDAYAPGKNAEIESGHAMVIVGYGFLEDKNKYYWLIQNSWGPYSCDKGLVKIEFGKTGVEQVAFGEAFLPEKEKEKNITEINIDYLGFDKKCNLLIDDKEKMVFNGTLEINFKNKEDYTDFFYYCTNNELPKGNSLKCFYEIYNYYKKKGTYIFNSYKSLSDESRFILNDNFKDKDFFFWGWVDMAPYIDNVLQDYYISSEGSIITLWFNPDGDDSIIPAIYANFEIETPLKKCEKVLINDYQEGEDYLISCTIQKDEMDYFRKYDPKDESIIYPLTYDILCGLRENSLTFVQTIDDKNYPIFTITDFYYQNEGEISGYNKVILYVDISGNVSNFDKDQDFFSLIYYTTDEDEEYGFYTSMIQCPIKTPVKIQTKYRINCDVDLAKRDTIKFKEMYLLPYIMLYKNDFPFEVKLKESIKGKVYNVNNYISLNFAFIIAIGLLLV